MMRRVYFIKPIGMDGPIKIGSAYEPHGRMWDLAAWSPYELELLHTEPNENDLEHRLHAFFADLHERREWFTAAPKLLAAIEDMKAGRFDFSQLPSPSYVTFPNRGTPLARKQLSLSLRVMWAERKRGTRCPFPVRYALMSGDHERVRKIEEWLTNGAAA